MANANAGCLVCKRDSEQVPLISFQYKGEDLWICPQHLPILIHDPTKLEDVLPGAENLEAADHHEKRLEIRARRRTRSARMP